MSAVDDIRKSLQDFLAPELRAIAVRLDAVEARLTQQDTQRQRDKEEILRAIQTLSDYSSLSERLARLESKVAQPH
jgi:cell division protein ZapA (FtsZ GTPase activity inhibitor)